MKSPYLHPCFAELMTQCSRHAFAALLLSACSRFLDELRQADVVVGSDGSGDFKTIVSSVPRSPRPNQIAAWTFDGKWNPKKQLRPTIQQARVIGLQISVGFSERVTVKAKPR